MAPAKERREIFVVGFMATMPLYTKLRGNHTLSQKLHGKRTVRQSGHLANAIRLISALNPAIFNPRL